MRRKNVIVADSSANLFQADCADFMPVPLKILAGEKEYVDNEALDVASMLADLKEYKGRSGTACPSVGNWLQAFGDAEEVYGVSLTSHLSGCYNAACIAAAANLLGIRIVGRASDAGDLEPLHKSRGEKRAMKQLWECMQESGYAGGKDRIRHSDNLNAAEMLSGEIRSSYPDADIQIGANRGLCSYYAEKGGILVGFESQR